MTVNTTKAVIAILGLLCTTVLMLFKTIEPSLGMPIVTALVFYAIGNGVGARQNNSDKLINRKDPDNGPNWDR